MGLMSLVYEKWVVKRLAVETEETSRKRKVARKWLIVMIASSNKRKILRHLTFAMRRKNRAASSQCTAKSQK